MTVINERRLADFGRKHPDARKALAAWLTITRDATWRNLVEVRQVLPTADGVEVRKGVVATIFNIRGNTYRLVTLIIYAAQTVDIVEVLTHAEYDKDSWKRRI